MARVRFENEQTRSVGCELGVSGRVPYGFLGRFDGARDLTRIASGNDEMVGLGIVSFAPACPNPKS